MSGLLVGILGARIVSGAVTELGGFRLIFALAAVLMLVIAILLWRALPPLPPAERMPYRGALRSVFALVAAEPVLRQRMALAVCRWRTSRCSGRPGLPARRRALRLQRGAHRPVRPRRRGGALIAPVAGRLDDRGRGGRR